jgi:hypothetical protein
LPHGKEKSDKEKGNKEKGEARKKKTPPKKDVNQLVASTVDQATG